MEDTSADVFLPSARCALDLEILHFRDAPVGRGFSHVVKP